MTITESRLSLDPDGDDFLLRRRAADGTTTSIKLSETDILTLAQSVPNLQKVVLARHQPRGDSHSPLAATEVAQIELNVDSLGESLLLTPISPSGNRITFAIPPNVAELLAQRLPAHVAKLTSAKPTRQ